MLKYELLYHYDDVNIYQTTLHTNPPNESSVSFYFDGTITSETAVGHISGCKIIPYYYGHNRSEVPI